MFLTSQLPAFFRDTPGDLSRIVGLLCSGEVVALPTETVYGLAADAMNTRAVRQIFTIKGRPLLDPLIVHINSLERLDELAESGAVRPYVDSLVGAGFWPGPLTLVLPRREKVPDLVTAGRTTVAIRFPAHPLMRKVLDLSGLVLAAPSANPFGYVSPTTAQHVRDSLGTGVPYILDGGACSAGIESTILDLSVEGEARILRPGPVTLEALQATLPLPIFSHLGGGQGGEEEDPSRGMKAPGLLARHYSPKTPMTLFSRMETITATNPSESALVFVSKSGVPPDLDFPHCFWLSEDGDLETVAHHLFELLRKLDAGGYAHLYWQLPPDHGIGTALRDRLQRASAR